jgi:hypothetical protein
LFDLVQKKGFDEEKLIKLLIFVFDFVHLPKPLEHEFLRETSEIIFPKIDTAMKVSAGVKEMADIFYQRAYGVNPKEERKAMKREREAIILKLYREASMTARQIAALLGYETGYVEHIVGAAAENAAKQNKS